MKYLYISLSVVYLLLIVISCKKDSPPAPQYIDITSVSCKLESYINQTKITARYGADNRISGLYHQGQAATDVPVEITRFQYENGLLRRVLSKEKRSLDPSDSTEAYTIYRFDYGPRGIESVSYYTTGNIGLLIRFEFKYGNYDKPTSMIEYANTNRMGSDDIMVAQYSSTYEYDENGNLVKELYKAIDPYDFTSHVFIHRYDNSPNSVKLFESFNFSSSSASRVFSTNNLVESDVAYNATMNPFLRVETVFDNDKKIIQTGPFWGIKWDCN